MTLPGATGVAERLDVLDILRGVALFGVLIVNLVTEFRVSIFAQFLDQPAAPYLTDRIVLQFVHHALEMKAFVLFSFLFGVGLAMQFDRLAATGRPLYWLTRRLTVLLVFGLVHLLLVWNGDILTEYAVAGLIVLPMLYASRGVLVLAAAALMALYLAMPALPIPLAWPDQHWLANHVAQANAVYRDGSWRQVMQFSLRELPALLPLHVAVFPRTLALFVLGMLAWRSGVFTQPARFRSIILSLASALGLIGVVLVLAGETGMFANVVPVCLSLAFACGIVHAVEHTPARAWLRSFAAIGRMAFTNYILQSLIFGLLFFGYGLGQFGRLRPAPVFVLGVAVYLVQIQLSKLWLRHYRFGPIEWCWRTLMYGHKQPMRR